jgi:hypothetical protein
MNLTDIIMNSGELNRLIEKYYNGDSTDVEEQALRELFRGDDAPDGYEAEKAIFGYYASEGEIPEPSFDFESRILAAIDASESENKTQKIRTNILPYLSAAATVLILIGSWFFFIHRSESDDTFTDPAIAYSETMKILLDVSEKMNRGAMALEPVRKIDEMTSQSMRTISKSTDKISKNMKDLGNVLEPLESSDKKLNDNIK